ncbi:hypothetical protein, partial [Thalassospira xianhensis]|uniref:hypothetical protein n=1 Tax=Thalassospira xianhensis TaxID=478503 RepID=UPI001ABF408B
RQRRRPKTVTSRLWILRRLTMPMRIHPQMAKKKNRAKPLPEQAAHAVVIRQLVVAAAALPVVKTAKKAQAKINRRKLFLPDSLPYAITTDPVGEIPRGLLFSGFEKQRFDWFIYRTVNWTS